jgi:hypothetical protein
MDRTMIHRLLGGCSALAICTAAPSAWSAINVTISSTFVAADGACQLPAYTIHGVGSGTTNDDGTGNDWIAVVMHDGSGNYLDVDYVPLEVSHDPFAVGVSYGLGLPFAGFFSARPLTVRVHDITNPGAINANSEAGIELASASPVLATLVIDPATDAAACAARRLYDPSLRIESIYNQNGQGLGSTPILVNLDVFGTKTINVATPEQSMLTVFYRAECVNDAADRTSFAEVDILIDGVEVAPTAGSSDAFCTANGIDGEDQAVMARTSAAKLVSGPAVHAVQVRGSSTPSSGSILSESTTVVMVPEPSRWWTSLSGLACVALLARRRRAPLLALALALPVLLGQSGARADTVLERTSFINNQVFDRALGPQWIDLGAGTSFALNLARNARVLISFTAECSVEAPNTGTYLNIDIFVDGAAVPPSDATEDAFCGSAGTNTLDSWIAAGMQVTIDLLPGAHTIQVRGDLINDAVGDRWHVGDLSLIVVGQEF